MIFERKGFYYLIYGHTCCFCDTGSGAETWWADNPLGPWKKFGIDINPVKLNGERTIKAQNNFVI